MNSQNMKGWFVVANIRKLVIIINKFQKTLLLPPQKKSMLNMENPTQKTSAENPAAAKPELIAKIKAQLGHLFDADDNGNITPKAKYKIPPFKMILVEGGKLVLGDDNVKPNPSHEVELTYNYFIGEFPVTQELYAAITGKNPSNFQGVNHPVEQVNWLEAVEFCNLLNKKLGLQPVCNEKYNFLDRQGKPTDDITKVIGFRLPTETEWEYAARGGASTGSASTGSAAAIAATDGGLSGSNHLDEVGWFSENNRYETKPVGLKFPNQLGIYDMSGNVWEWCLDWYDGDFYKKDQKLVNPVNLKKSSARVLRGGSWLNGADIGRLAYRGYGGPGASWRRDGFRLVFAFQFT
jgi:formylglycine-generating enzyme